MLQQLQTILTPGLMIGIISVLLLILWVIRGFRRNSPFVILCAYFGLTIVGGIVWVICMAGPWTMVSYCVISKKCGG